MRRLSARVAAAACLAMLLIAGMAVAQGTVFHGNAKTHVFHRQGCRYFDCATCTVTFSSRDAAVEAGYQPCKVCRP